MKEVIRQTMIAKRRAKLMKFDELRASGMLPKTAVTESGFPSMSAVHSARYEEKKLAGKARPYSSRKNKPKKNEVIVVNSDDREEDVKIVVMKGPGHVIEKIAAALGGVL